MSVLDSFGRIRFSSEKKRYTDVKYYKQAKSTALFTDSKILNSTSLEFVQSLLTKKYSISVLCYRASEVGFASSKFHAGCDYKGPTLTIVRGSTGKIGGGYTG